MSSAVFLLSMLSIEEIHSTTCVLLENLKTHFFFHLPTNHLSGILDWRSLIFLNLQGTHEILEQDKESMVYSSR